MNCRIEIFTETQGIVNKFSAKGEFLGEGCVRFPQDGEEVVLRASERGLSLERKSLSMRFLPNRRTTGTLRFGDRSGSFSINTLRYSYSAREILLAYRLEFPADRQDFSLRIVLEDL